MIEELDNSNKIFPNKIPIFPLSGVVMFPNTYLPLNIFETRYINMFNHALTSEHKLIGMVQPFSEQTKKDQIKLYDIGCAGRIIKFEETEDNRFLITLKGISRFNLISDKTNTHNFKIAEVNWNKFQEDLKQKNNHSSHETLKGILKKYFYLKKIKVDMSIIDKCNDYNLADQLTMICPLTSEEKQMLLETHSLTKRNQLLLSIIEISNRELDTSDVIKH